MNGKTHPRRGLHGRKGIGDVHRGGKTILLFAILLIMATFVLTGLSIWKASEAAQLDLRQSLGGKFDVFVDWSNSPYVVKEFEQK